MFYSHEVLTSRRYGVATIWLVATLGAKSNTKKVGKKAILDVDVKKACETIIEPEAPMALRLKSSLLYGVSRVYDQQCAYVLSDVQTLQNTMRGLLKIIRDRGLDLEAGKARPDQLLLHDDPAFLPSLELPALNFDLGALDWSQPLASQMSPGRTQSQRSRSSSNSLLDINIRSSSGSNDYQLPAPHSFTDGSNQKIYGMGRVVDDEPLIFEDDLDFEFMEDGQLRDRVLPAVPFPALQSDSATSDRLSVVDNAMQLGRSGVEMEDPFALDLPEIDQQLPDAEAFPTGRKRAQSSASVNVDDLEASSAEAPQRKKRRTRKAKVIMLLADKSTQIDADEIKSLSATTYLEKMKEERRETERKNELKNAKQTAYNAIFGVGLNGAAIGYGMARKVGELAAVFAGDSLFVAVMGAEAPNTKTKTHADVNEEEMVEEQSTGEQSAKSQQDQIGRGGDDDVFQADFEDDLEVARRASNALDDHPSSVMPWNVSASLHSRHTGSILLGRHSSVPLQGRHSRLTSASPLLGRGRLDSTDVHAINENMTDMDDFNRLDGGSSEHDYGGAGAGFPSSAQATDKFSNQINVPEVGNTQTGESTQMMREAIAKESTGFYEWVRNTIDEQDVDDLEKDDLDGTGRIKTVGFDTLIPAEASTVMIAASAFHHVLTLATKGLLTIRQEIAFGDIELGMRDMAM